MLRRVKGNAMKNRLLLLILASAAVVSGCVTTAGYRGQGGGYYGKYGSSQDHYRYSSYPYGYYGGTGTYYGYDRYGYDRYGYDRYGRSYGYPYGYAQYYNNRYYYYYYPTPHPPVTGTQNPPPPPPLDPNRSLREQSRYPRPQVMTSPVDGTPYPGLSRYRSMRNATTAPDYQEHAYPERAYQEPAERAPSVMDSPRRIRQMREFPMPMPASAPRSSSGEVTPAAESPSQLKRER